MAIITTTASTVIIAIIVIIVILSCWAMSPLSMGLMLTCLGLPLYRALFSRRVYIQVWIYIQKTVRYEHE